MQLGDRLPIIRLGLAFSSIEPTQKEKTMELRRIIERIEDSPSLPSGRVDRFAGYAVIGHPFRSGHVLALRRFSASSLGPGYASIWHCNPTGHWAFHSTVVPEQSCFAEECASKREVR
jgi:hypothetical protein